MYAIEDSRQARTVHKARNEESTGVLRQPRSHVQVVNGCNIRKWYDDCRPC